MTFCRITIVWLLAAGVLVQVEATADEVSPPITVESLSGASYDLLREGLQKERTSRTQQLLTVLNEAEPGSRAQLHAIFLSGELGFTETVPWLIENITRVKQNVMHADPGYHEVYPCVSALARLGKPASEAAIRAIAVEDNPKRRGALVYVLKANEGQVVAALILEREIDMQEGDAKAQGRLKSALSSGFAWWGVRLTYPDRWPTEGDLRW